MAARRVRQGLPYTTNKVKARHLKPQKSQKSIISFNITALHTNELVFSINKSIQNDKHIVNRRQQRAKCKYPPEPNAAPLIKYHVSQQDTG